MSATQRTTTVLGVLLTLAGIVGFAAPGLLGMHLTAAHNLIHLVSGVLALYFGMNGTPRATKDFCILFGSVYGLLGLVGLVAGGADGTLALSSHLMFGRVDHIVHLLLGAVFLIAGLYKKPVDIAQPPRRKPPLTKGTI